MSTVVDSDVLPLRLRGRTVRIGEPLLMGIVNASPDSFSDPGGRSPDRLAQHARELAAAGAALIDDGGAAVLRVHDVAAARDYLRVRAALRCESHVVRLLDIALDQSAGVEVDPQRSVSRP